MHERIDLMIFGQSFRSVHELIDAPAKDMGMFHRAIYHDPMTLIMSDPHLQPIIFAHHMTDIFLTPLMPFFEAHAFNPAFVQIGPGKAFEGYMKWRGEKGIHRTP